jgi:hypothetical protein
LQYKLCKLEFSTKVIKLISSFLSKWKFRVFSEGEMSTLRDILAGVPWGSVLLPTLYKLYINDDPQTIDVNLALFVDDACIMQINTRKAMSSENSSEDLIQWRPGGNAWTYKLTKRRLGQSTSPIRLDHLRPLLHWMKVIFLLQII